MELYLIRHGHCFTAGSQNYDSGKRTANPTLTQKGREQAASLAEKLKDIHFDSIYCSDLLRAQETAEILNSILACGIIEDQRFREIDMGELFLSSWSEFPDLYSEWSKHEHDLCYPGGENGQMVWQRCQTALNEILQNGFERVAVVAHGGTIRSIVSGILGMPQEKRFYLGLPPENCGVSIIKYNKADGKPYLHIFNVIL